MFESARIEARRDALLGHRVPHALDDLLLELLLRQHPRLGCDLHRLAGSDVLKVGAISDNGVKVQRLLMQESSLSFDGPDDGLQNETLTKLNKATDDKVAAVLTADQKAKLKEFLGKPFTGELGPRFGGGFPGGGGGFGGGFFGGGILGGFAPPA